MLDSAPGFALLDLGTLPFAGRDGARLWKELCTAIADRWDEVIDALDALVGTPEVDPAALLAARNEPAGAGRRAAGDADAAGEGAAASGRRPLRTTRHRPTLPASGWRSASTRSGSPPRTTSCTRCAATWTTNRSSSASDGTIAAFRSLRALIRYLAVDGADGHDLAQVSTWPEVVERATAGELSAAVDETNDYLLLGVDDDLAEGPLAVDPVQLELAAELLRDAGQWSGDGEPAEALAESESLGWLVSFVIRPDPTRLAPSAPFDREVARWRELVDDFTKRLDLHS